MSGRTSGGSHSSPGSHSGLPAGWPSRARRAAALFSDALECLDAGAFLDAACDDSRLRAEVESLLAAHATAGDALTPPTLGRVPEAGALVGEEVGPWRIDALLGEGGMGAVYRARHTETGVLHALKIIRPDRKESELVRRFEREALVMARVDKHPGIARISDGMNGR